MWGRTSAEARAPWQRAAQLFLLALRLRRPRRRHERPTSCRAQAGVKGNTGAPAAGGFGTPALGFGAPPAAGSPFGGTPAATPAFGGFGGGGTPATPAFGSAAFGGASTPAFGAAAPANAFGSLSSTPAFGAPPASAPAFGSFGGASTPAFGAATGSSSFGGVFGAPASTPAFSFASSAPAFGAPVASAPAFGAPASAPSPFGFGGGAGGLGGFGAPASSAAFSFASSSPAFGAASSPSLFGSAQASQPFGASPGGFGSNLFGQAAKPAGGGMFGSTATGLGQSPAPFSFANTGAAFGQAAAPAFGAPFGGGAPAAPGAFSFALPGQQAQAQQQQMQQQHMMVPLQAPGAPPPRARTSTQRAPTLKLGPLGVPLTAAGSACSGLQRAISEQGWPSALLRPHVHPQLWRSNYPTLTWEAAATGVATSPYGVLPAAPQVAGGALPEHRVGITARPPGGGGAYGRPAAVVAPRSITPRAGVRLRSGRARGIARCARAAPCGQCASLSVVALPHGCLGPPWHSLLFTVATAEQLESV